MNQKGKFSIALRLPLISLPSEDRNKKYRTCDTDGQNDVRAVSQSPGDTDRHISDINMDFKPRSSSVIPDRQDESSRIEYLRARAGSLFVPNICVHCKLLEEMENSATGFRTFISSCSDEEDSSSSSYKTSSSSYYSSLSSSPANGSGRSSLVNETDSRGFTREFGQFLEVPIWKPRASSLDAGLYKNEPVKCRSRKGSFEESLGPEKPRATSVDVHIEVHNPKIHSDSQNKNDESKKSSKQRFSIISVSSRQTISRVIQRLRTSNLRLWSSRIENSDYCSKWRSDTRSREHIWYPVNALRQRCTVFSCTEYTASEVFKCSVCKAVACDSCKPALNNLCRRTFIRQEAEEISDERSLRQHHWVHKNRQNGICKTCSKTVTSHLFFSNKQTVESIQCSWCKTIYHNKKTCFTKFLLSECCSMGDLKVSILQPYLVKKQSVLADMSKNEEDQDSDSNSENYSFEQFKIENSSETPLVKEIEYSLLTPIIVMINPKSGGRQGLQVLNELQWVLNPRQVFDITVISPDDILKFFSPTRQLKILIGGGDGTVNWILRSVEKYFNCGKNPPVAIIPIGTGNDLARELNWGSSFNSKDSLSKLIADIEAGPIIQFDIWRIYSRSLISKQSPYPSSMNNALFEEKFNNYFSLGSDAATALEFHRNRERNPQRYNSRLRNKLSYVEIGGKDLLKREYRNLTDNISLKCDGIDYNSYLAQKRPHCILFLNITNYSAGTNPWGRQISNSEFTAQSANDGFLEVIGLSAATLATLHMGGQGDRISQCRMAEIEIRQPIPIQIDGEPLLINPCVLRIEHSHQYPFVKRKLVPD